MSVNELKLSCMYSCSPELTLAQALCKVDTVPPLVPDWKGQSSPRGPSQRVFPAGETPSLYHHYFISHDIIMTTQ